MVAILDCCKNDGAHGAQRKAKCISDKALTRTGVCGMTTSAVVGVAVAAIAVIAFILAPTILGVLGVTGVISSVSTLGWLTCSLSPINIVFGVMGITGALSASQLGWAILATSIAPVAVGVVFSLGLCGAAGSGCLAAAPGCLTGGGMVWCGDAKGLGLRF